MYTITFYSFKGGVGRTLALMNTAAQLAKMGRKVLLVDFDLEAPGLETFHRLVPGGPARRVKRLEIFERLECPEPLKDGVRDYIIRKIDEPPTHPGMVEYVTEYMRTKCAPDVRDYIYSAGTVGKKGGQLWVMPAGRRDAQYQSALSKIDWLALYREHDGFLLFEDAKAQWEQEFKPDYVLIDSRTGHTDVEGICTRHLPDAVVAFFYPNAQNLNGLREVCRQIRGERTRGLMKDIRLHFVMSNVPDLDDENGILSSFLLVFGADLGFDQPDAVIHRYESAMLFDQAIFVLDRPKSRLAREYRRLVRSLITHNPADRDGALFFLSAYCRHLKNTADLNLTHAGASLFKIASVDYGLSRSSSDPLAQIAGSFLADAEVQELVGRCREAEKILKERCEQAASESPQQQA